MVNDHYNQSKPVRENKNMLARARSAIIAIIQGILQEIVQERIDNLSLVLSRGSLRAVKRCHEPCTSQSVGKMLLCCIMPGVAIQF